MKETPVKIFITWNGKQIGPYSLTIIERMVEAQTLKLNDLAWYEGLSDWICVKDIPGFVYRTRPPREKTYEFPIESIRPNLVWFFCIGSFFALPLLIWWQAYLVYSLATKSQSLPPDLVFLRNLFPTDSTHFTIILVSISIFGTLLQLGGAILLFLIRKNSLILYMAAFLVHLLVPAIMWTESDQGLGWVIFLVVYYGFILWNFGTLKKKDILR